MSGMSQIEIPEGTVIGLTSKDIEKYGVSIKEVYNISLKEIPIKYIGGCILENKIQGIFIDNTLLNSVNERLEG